MDDTNKGQENIRHEGMQYQSLTERKQVDDDIHSAADIVFRIKELVDMVCSILRSPLGSTSKAMHGVT